MVQSKDLDRIFKRIDQLQREMKHALTKGTPKDIVLIMNQLRELKNDPVFAESRKRINKERLGKRRHYHTLGIPKD